MARAAVTPDGGLRMGTPQGRWVLLATVLASCQGLGLTRMSMPFILGTMVTPNRDHAKPIGFGMHLINGWLFATLYAAAPGREYYEVLYADANGVALRAAASSGVRTFTLQGAGNASGVTRGQGIRPNQTFVSGFSQ